MRSDIHCPVLFSKFFVYICLYLTHIHIWCVCVPPIYFPLCAGCCLDVEVSPVVGFTSAQAATELLLKTIVLSM